MPENLEPVTYSVSGLVIEGHHQGDALGARTANLDLAAAKDLPPGLYVGRVSWAGKNFPGLLYFGINSLTNADCLEVHVLDFVGDLYGQPITFITSHYLRPPQQFASLELLATQIKKDLQQAHQLLNT